MVETAVCHVWTGAVGGDGYGRFAVSGPGGTRMLTPHQVAASLRFGPIPEGATLLHDCEVRLCCRTDAGHVRVGTQRENMRQAAARGRAVGPRPGRVDVRGNVGASRAVQGALLDAVSEGVRSPAALAAVLAATLADGDPLRDVDPLFVLPSVAGTTGAGSRGDGATPDDAVVITTAALPGRAAAQLWALFDL